MATYQPPLLHNGSLNTVFNSSDYSNTNSKAYLPISGGTLTGSLNGIGATFTGTVNVSSLVSQSGYTLQTTYSAVPTQTQIGGAVSATMLSGSTAITTATLTQLGSITSLPAGVWSILATIPVVASAATTLSNFIVSISTSNSAHDQTSAIQSYASQTLASGAISTVQVEKILRLTTATPVYILGTFTGASLTTSASAIATAVRMG
jgi:hypothetical protein